MAKYFLAIDKGSGKLADDSDRYINIDISKLGYTVPLKRKDKIINEPRDYFTSIDSAIEFTSQFENYAELFKLCYDKGLISDEFVGKPFTFSFFSQKRNNRDSKWKHYGDCSLISQNKVFFKDDVDLLHVPSDSDLKKMYKNIEIDDKLGILARYQELELGIPEFFILENAPMEEQEKFATLLDFCDKVQHMINEKKNAKIYQAQIPFDEDFNNYTKFVNSLENNLKDIRSYLNKAKNDHTVRPEYFYEQIKKIINGLCLEKDNDNGTYKVNKAGLFELVSYTKAYQEKDDLSYKIQLQKLRLNIEKEKLEKEIGFKPTYGIQIDMWGNEVPESSLIRRRKR